MRDKIYNLLKLFLCLLFFFFFSEIVVFIFNIFNIDLTKLSMKGKSVYQFIMSLLIFIMLLVVYFKNIKKDAIEFKKDLRKNIIYVIKLFFIFMIVKIGVAFLSSFIMVVLKMDVNSITSVNQSALEDFIKVSPLIMVITTGFIGPFYEEGLFRLGFRKVIGNKFLFVIISGFVFGLMHIFPLSEGVSLTLGIIQSISYVTMGIFLACVYAKTDNIFTSIGVHLLNNLLSVLMMINMY